MSLQTSGLWMSNGRYLIFMIRARKCPQARKRTLAEDFEFGWSNHHCENPVLGDFFMLSPKFFSVRAAGGGFHFRGLKAFKSVVLAPSARGLRQLLWFSKEFVLWNDARKGILNSNFDDRGDSTSERRFKSIKNVRFLLSSSKNLLNRNAIKRKNMVIWGYFTAPKSPRKNFGVKH